MKKPKITFIIYSLSLGGAERVLSTLANNLIKNYEVSVITIAEIDSFYNLDSEIKVTSCIKENRKGSWLIEPLYRNYLILKKINVIVKENNTDLIISFMTTANVLGTLIGLLNKVPVIISERTNPYHQRIPKIWDLLRTITYRFSDVLVVQTETIKKFFDKKISTKKLIILPNPISIELTNKRFLTDQSQKKNIVLSVGRLNSLKAFDMLIKAFAQTNHTNWELWIAGDGQEHNNLQKLINELELNDHVKLLGLVKDIYKLYNISKIFAFSSTYEGFPNVLIEAMHFGLACVSTDCPTGPSELIKNGENGYLVPVGDIDEMRDKLSSLMKEQSKIKQFGEKSIITVQRYEEEKVVEQWKEVINGLL
tara:strand:- start:33 stop:1130 length:1098 start_codon:yes stop_codon:yes gene_type:complete